jgi:NADH-quinone oxidoreductase subunit H
MTDVWGAVAALLAWPGLVGGAALGWFYLWIGRKLTARAQGRQGPPLLQPFYDFVKLLGKQAVTPAGVSAALFFGLPVVSLASALLALALLPVPGNPMPSFAGDLVVLIYLLEMPALVEVLAGYASRSLYGQVAAMREAALMLAYNLPFLAAVIALAVQAHSFELRAVAGQPFGPVHVFAGVAFLLALPARLKSNPFSIANAESEIVAGANIEFNAAPLALFELSHALQLVALIGLCASLIIPVSAGPLIAWPVYLLVSLLLLVGTTLVAAGTARLTVRSAFRFYWTWGLAAALLALAATWVW